MSTVGLHFAAVAVGGAIGGILRAWLAGVIGRRFGEGFPWGTLTVNVTGSTLIGVAAGLSLSADAMWSLLVIGVLGSYTTVSSFSHQTLVLLHSGEAGRAAANIAASLVLCLAAAATAYASVGSMLGA